MPSTQCESDGEIAFLVRFGFQMGCAREISYRPTSLMCIWAQYGIDLPGSLHTNKIPLSLGRYPLLGFFAA